MDPRLERLREEGIYIGTSSWKYEGWKELIYCRTYKTKKDFNENCLNEYAEHFTAVGVDHTYYTWPNPNGIRKYVEQTPDRFLFALKATEHATVLKYPKHRRYGKVAGTLNHSFLEVAPFEDRFLGPLEPFHKRLAPIMLEFSQFFPGMLSSGQEFVDRLGDFLEPLTKHKKFRFAVEMRNSNWLKKPYFELLAKLRVGHVYNSWTRMPSIGDQLEQTDKLKLPFLSSRVLLKPGKKYAQAVESYSPYSEIKDKHPDIRTDAARLIQRARSMGIPAYVFVNNRCEGCAPLTIAAILDQLEFKTLQNASSG